MTGASRPRSVLLQTANTRRDYYSLTALASVKQLLKLGTVVHTAVPASEAEATGPCSNGSQAGLNSEICLKTKTRGCRDRGLSSYEDVSDNKTNPDNVNVNWSATFKTTPQNRTKESNDSTPGRHTLARNGTRAHTQKKKTHKSKRIN